ncbi:type III glutamate--ammonia ligase [Methylacidimicrobium tartarophylax]|uniref:Glutamine synthetase n=1 Tax=Methylacidimicrobium tartarophylax TaxID=1041768 RepID=A0A5E6MAQ2_9BACT|nr:type III glutamate--ammonia ligase [Methylacidimicrobium tartarophylax]VVM04834.1 glutamine synthetase [Methylacidimicrobium tartarophylax]
MDPLPAAMHLPSKIQEIRENLQRQNIRYFLPAFVDIHGVPKGKLVPLSHVERSLRGGELFSGHALDGLGSHPEDGEVAVAPDWERGFPVPWKPELAWIPSHLTFADAPFPACTRAALKRSLEKAEDQGFRLRLGIECELYLLQRGASGRLLFPSPRETLPKGSYDAGRLLERANIIDRILEALEGLEWEVSSVQHEDGRSQFEFVFSHCEALEMADRLVFFRCLASRIASEQGLAAVFMAKPFADQPGNAAHFHLSLADSRTGANLFLAEPGEDPRGLGLSGLGYAFLAGLLRHGRSLCAAFAPTVNSYKRLIKKGAMQFYSWAPVFNSLGGNNRTHAFRIPLGGGQCEVRIPDSSCNPYLAAALVLEAGLEGVQQNLDPRAPERKSIYSWPERQKNWLPHEDLLPRSLGEALAEFASDPLVEKALGRSLREEFLRCKFAEWDEYNQEVTHWEVMRYATLF